MQILPTDLANVEIIKGSASSLYGGSALGGVINLISRTPSDEYEGEVLLNASSNKTSMLNEREINLGVFVKVASLFTFSIWRLKNAIY